MLTTAPGGTEDTISSPRVDAAAVAGAGSCVRPGLAARAALGVISWTSRGVDEDDESSAGGGVTSGSVAAFVCGSAAAGACAGLDGLSSTTASTISTTTPPALTAIHCHNDFFAALGLAFTTGTGFLTCLVVVVAVAAVVVVVAAAGATGVAAPELVVVTPAAASIFLGAASVGSGILMVWRLVVSRPAPGKLAARIGPFMASSSAVTSSSPLWYRSAGFFASPFMITRDTASGTRELAWVSVNGVTSEMLRSISLTCLPANGWRVVNSSYRIVASVNRFAARSTGRLRISSGET